jgi:hypothetical protein
MVYNIAEIKYTSFYPVLMQTLCTQGNLLPLDLKMAFLLIYLHITALCIMGGGSLEPRTAIAGSFSAWGGLGELDRGLGRGVPFFSDSESDSDSDEAFQISRKLGLVHVEFFCVLVQQL